VLGGAWWAAGGSEHSLTHKLHGRARCFLFYGERLLCRPVLLQMLLGQRAWAGRQPVQILYARTTGKEKLEVPEDVACPPAFRVSLRMHASVFRGLQAIQGIHTMEDSHRM
jgi:hypothetical protein